MYTVLLLIPNEDCTTGRNRKDPCFRACVTSTVVRTKNTTGMDKSSMIAAWDAAFVEGTGCPQVPVTTATDYHAEGDIFQYVGKTNQL